MASKVHHISNPELRAVFQSYQVGIWDFNSEEERIIRLVAKALDKSEALDLKEDDWEVFRSLRVKTTGSSYLTQTFEETIGIPARVVKPTVGEVLYQPSTLLFLLSPWHGASREEISKDIQSLRADEKKLLLEALAFFSVTDRAMVLDRKKGIVLYSMTKRLQDISKGRKSKSEAPEEALIVSQNFFQDLYAELRGIPISKDQIKANATIDIYLKNASETLPRVKNIIDLSTNWDEEGKWIGDEEDLKVIDQILGTENLTRQEIQKLYEQQVTMESAQHGLTFPGPAKLPGSLRKELLTKGEERVHQEILHGLGKLMEAWDRLKTRGQPDLIAEDVFYNQLQVEKVKVIALTNYYKPHVRDPHFSLLYAKALIDLDRVLRLEEEFLSFPEGLRKKRGELAFVLGHFLERARILGVEKAAILQSQFLRETKNWNDQERNEVYYKKALEHLNLEDVEAQIEAAAVHTLAWRHRVEGATEEKALQLLRPLGRRGGEVLSQLFQAGSAEAGEEILKLLEQKLTREYAQKYYLQRLLSAIAAFFSFGYVNLEKLKEGSFFDPQPHQLSKREVDFLITATVAGIPSAQEVLDRALEKRLGPKYRLIQADKFLQSLELPYAEPYLPVNRRDAYRYFEDAGNYHLQRQKLGIEPPQGFINLLGNYLEKLDPESHPYDILFFLHLKLLRSRPPSSYSEDLEEVSQMDDEKSPEDEMQLTVLPSTRKEEDKDKVHLILDLGGHQLGVVALPQHLGPIRQMMSFANPSPNARFSSQPQDFLNLLSVIHRTFPSLNQLLRREPMGFTVSRNFLSVSGASKKELSVSKRVHEAMNNATRGEQVQEFLRQCYEELPNGTGVVLTTLGAMVAITAYILSRGAAAGDGGAQELIKALTLPQMETAVVAAQNGGGVALARLVLKYGPQVVMMGLSVMSKKNLILPRL
jgi:hypothetical protein